MKGAVLPLGLVLAWQGTATVFGLQSDTLSDPLQVLAALAAGLGDASILRATVQTVGAAAAGLMLGAGLGAVTGLVCGLLPVLSRLLRLLIEVLRPVPAVAMIPIALLVFGFGARLEISVVGFACFFPMLILTETAVRGLHPLGRDVARMLRLSLPQRVVKMVLPAILPRLFVALRLCAGIALIVAVTVEISSNPMGLGYRLMLAGQSMRPADMFATLLWIGLLGWGLNLALVRAEHWLFATGARA
ncbi:ABC transporter permease subunit [Pseudooceanicola sp. CBS1P-1]|uniref:ABC transporter permease subunit n=1 Tax=Pseudooceanicola albus TaxID=2692189 RepID=A0A6L7GDX6_9RHOB|nr:MULTISPECIES: ABC transporter permease subunit [Pseudooceanicola]MBT9386789.1 ABC transporter permease subunit [Pseudooceanicola endophyticus]MXN20953.1 ABC transporter permease subunit [Pseudooceanicola albus]